jgi:hypothetical protein
VTGGWYLPLVRRSQYSLAGTFQCRRSRLLKTGLFREVRELKIQRKIPGSALSFQKLSNLPGTTDPNIKK